MDNTLPIDLDELRDTLNRYVELEEENEDYRDCAIKDAKIISSLRRRISALMSEVKELTHYKAGKEKRGSEE